MKTIICTLCILFSLNAFSFIASDAEEFEFCEKMTFDNNQQECVSVITRHMFTTDALNFCTLQYFDNQKQDCIELVADKKYSSAGLTYCRNLNFDNQKLDCVRRLGYEPIIVSPIPNPCQIINLRQRLVHAMNEFRGGYLQYGMSIIDGIIMEIPAICR